jgi:RNA polymerase sigma factor (sigma-70 family)
VTKSEFLKWWAELEPVLLKKAHWYRQGLGDAQDAVQDIALLALQNYQRFDEKSEFRKWALARLHWRLLDEFRHKKHLHIESMEDIAAPTAATPEDQIAFGNLMESLETLPPRQQEVIRMTIQGYSSALIAKHMDINEATVRSLRRFARSRIATLIAERDYENEHKHQG